MALASVGPLAELSVAVVIPALNEERTIADAVRSCLAGDVSRVVVVDGESRDRTVEVAESVGATTLSAPRGRSLQMNAGATLCASDIIVFLHADARLPSGFTQEIRRLLSKPEVVGGSFPMRLDSDRLLLRLSAMFSNARARYLGLPFGDQAIFVRRTAFERVGGFRPVGLFEDVELCRALKNLGRLEVAGLNVLNSSRRWRSEGLLKVIFRNWMLELAYVLGVSPDTLARFYGPEVR